MCKADQKTNGSVGFTLGKFAPLHQGHQYLIEQALRQVDHLIVMIYECADVIDVPLQRRAGWIETLYPQVEVILAPDGPMEVSNAPEIRRVHEDYIGKKLCGRRITHFFSSEFYGQHVSRFLNAKDCRVDESRSTVSISATEIRKNPYHHRQWLHPLIYRDLIKKVVFIGAPSTGKTTLTQKMAEEMNTCWMPEYGREYWQQHQVNRRLNPDQLIDIAEGHLAGEEALLSQSNRYLFVDTNALTTWQFAQYYHGFALPQLEGLAEATKSRYDVVFLCGDDIPYDDTWDRSGEVNRRQFQHAIVAELKKREIGYTLLLGDLEQRVAQVKHILQNL